MYGYHGKILTVDLTKEKISHIPLDPKMARDFIGGAGLACRILYDMIDGRTLPLAPENPLVLMTGPFAGTMVPTGSKMSVCARSPLTGIWGYSTVGGHMGADLKFAGYDGIIITGQSKMPFYLLIKDDSVTLEDLYGVKTQNRLGIY